MIGRSPVLTIVFAALLATGCAVFNNDDQRDPTDDLGPLDYARHAAQKCDLSKSRDEESPIKSDAHILAVNSRGYVVNLLKPIEPSDKYEPNAVYEQTIRAILKQYLNFRAENAGRRIRIVIYLNGGLNGECHVRKQAAEQVPLMREDGIFPVFLAWSTDGFETYREQIGHVRRGRFHDTLLWDTAPIHVLSHISEGIARYPTDLIDQWTRYKSTVLDVHEPTFHLHKNYKWQKRDGCTDARCNVLFADAGNNEYDLPNPILYPTFMPARLVSTPIISGIGRAAWQNMLRRTRVTVHWPDEFRARIRCEKDGKGDWGCSRDYVERLLEKYPRGLGGFARLFYDFELCLSDISEKTDNFSECVGRDLIKLEHRIALRDAAVTFIGHSMGTIVLNEVLPFFPALMEKVDSIVYMASAARIRDSVRSLVPLLQRNKDLKFYNLMLHPLADAREPVIYTAAPSGSLLEWIDEMYESPETVLDRTFGKWRNVRVAKHVFPIDVQDQMTFKVFAPKRVPKNPCRSTPDPKDTEGCLFGRPGEWKPKTNPMTHGGFNDNDMRYWCPAFWGAKKDQKNEMDSKSIDVCTSARPREPNAIAIRR